MDLFQTSNSVLVQLVTSSLTLAAWSSVFYQELLKLREHRPLCLLRVYSLCFSLWQSVICAHASSLIPTHGEGRCVATATMASLLTMAQLVMTLASGSLLVYVCQPATQCCFTCPHSRFPPFLVNNTKQDALMLAWHAFCFCRWKGLSHGSR